MAADAAAMRDQTTAVLPCQRFAPYEIYVGDAALESRDNCSNIESPAVLTLHVVSQHADVYTGLKDVCDVFRIFNKNTWTKEKVIPADAKLQCNVISSVACAVATTVFHKLPDKVCQ